MEQFGQADGVCINVRASDKFHKKFSVDIACETFKSYINFQRESYMERVGFKKDVERSYNKVKINASEPSSSIFGFYSV